MKKQKIVNKGLKQKLNIKDISERNEIDAFYTAIALSDKAIMNIKEKGNVYKAVIIEGESKILARIENTVYNFPAFITVQGTKAKLTAAYAELKKRKSLEKIE